MPDDDIADLRAALAKYGFAAAALHIDTRILRDPRTIRDAVRAWDRYPKNMDDYPTHLRRRPEPTR